MTNSAAAAVIVDQQCLFSAVEAIAAATLVVWESILGNTSRWWKARIGNRMACVGGRRRYGFDAWDDA